LIHDLTSSQRGDALQLTFGICRCINCAKEWPVENGIAIHPALLLAPAIILQQLVARRGQYGVG
jgi:hypothetical protein